MLSQYIPVGVYAWNPNGNDPVAEAAFESSVGQITSITGQAPQYIDAFFDDTAWSSMVPSAQWVSWSQSQSPVAKDMHPVVAVPLGIWGDNGIGTLQQIASGAHDDVYRGIAAAYKAAGYSSIDVRIGWEMDGTYMPWSMGSDANQASAWKDAFAHVADVFHSIAGMNVSVVWNPGLSNNNAVDVTTTYPGDDKVDVIGLDIYSHTYKYDQSVGDQQFYDYPAASASNPTGIDSVQWGLVQAANFASAHGKPLGIAESGVATGDNTALPRAIADVFNAPGAPVARYVNIWDVTTAEGDWKFTDGNNPTAAQAWASLNSGSQPSSQPAPVTPAPVTPAPATPAPVTVAPVIPASVAPSSIAPISVATTIPDIGMTQFLTAGANRAEAAWGAAEISGDAGGDSYVVHPGDATFVLDNYNASKGDVLQISSSLQGTIQQQQVSGGTMLSFANDPSNTQAVYLKNVSWLDQSAIQWT